MFKLAVMEEKLGKIESSREAKFKQLRRMLRDKTIGEERLLLIEGKRQILSALESNLRVKELIYSADKKGEQALAEILAVHQGDLPLLQMKKSLFAEIAETKNSQGIILLASLPQPLIEIKDFLSAGKGPLLLLENVQDPGNTGTLIRTAEALSFAGVAITDGGCDPYNGKALRASMGAAFRLPLFTGIKLNDLVKMLLANCYHLYAADMAGKPVQELDFSSQEKIALLVGNEGSGISDLARGAFELVSVPMRKEAESLNVAMAATILCWEIKRQKKNPAV